MPTIRYEIRSEYGLADPELYQAADKDDPEALLEGVSMAGLVGVLRQLGDLAEFAAKIFHDLHEEVTATSARGHGLMLRVQQLEAEFPSIEMDLLNQTSHSNYAYNEGIDWHTNLRVDQNLVTQGDMPRFILDSCEECRGPPRLFMLDKFDVAGAGACLKRYSDPSIFRVELASSGLMEEEVQLEMKARKIKKRTSPWKNGEATDSFLATLVTPKLQPQSSDQIPSKVPTRHIKLKCRNLSDPNITSRRSYMKHLLEKHSTEEKVWSENATTHSPLIIDSIDSNELTPEISETVINTITDSNLVREGTLTESPTRKEVAYIPPKELENHHKVKNVEISKSVRRKMVMTGAETANEEVNCVSDKAEFRSAEFTTEGSFGGNIFNGYTTDVDQMAPTVYPDWKLNPEWNLKKALADAEFTQWDLHDHKSDDIGSDLEKYGDALNTMESETETDSDHKIKSDPGFSSTVVHDMTSGIYEQQDEIPPQLSPDSVEESITSNSVISHVLVHPQSLNPKSSLNLPAIPEIYLKSEVEEDAATVNVLPNGTCNGKELETTSIELEIKEASSGSSLLDSAPSHTNTYSEGGDEAQSFIPLPDYSAGTYAVSQELDCQVESSEFSKNPDTFFLVFSPISEMRDSSIVTKDEGIHPAECIEEESSVNIEGALDISDHLSSMLNESTLADIPTQHIEEPAVVLTANLEGELQGSLKQAADICLDGNSSPTIPELSSEIDPTTVDPEDSADSEQDTEVCLDRSISPTIPDLSSEIDPITVHPEDLVDNEQDADICLDGNTSPTIPELSAEIAPAALHQKDLADSEYTECFGYSSYFPDTLLPLTEIPWKSNFSKDDEPKYSRDMDAMQEENIPEIAVKHVEDSSVSKLQLEVSQVAITQENSTCFGEDTSPSYSSLAPRNSEFITQTDAVARNSEFITQTDAVAIGGGNIVAVGEGSDAEDIKPLGLENLSNSENPQESHEVNQEEVLLSSGKADLPDGTNQHLNFSTEDMVEDNVLLPYIEPLVLGGSADPMEPNESQDAHMLEHIPEDVVLLNEEHLGMTCSDAEEPKESDGVTDVVDFPDGSTEDNLQEEAVHVGKRTECDDSLDEYVIVEADDINCDSSSFYAGKASEFDVQLQEDYLPYGSILSRHDTEVNDASEHKNLTLMPQGEPQPVTSTALSCSELPTELLYGVYCPISSETNIAKGSSLNSSENKDSVPEDVISPLTHSLVMDELISGDDSEPNEVSFSTEGEPDSVSSHREGEYLEALSTNEENNIESICRNIEDQPSKRRPCLIFSAAEIDEIELPLSNIDIHETEKDEPAIASKSSAEIPVATLGSSILSSELPSTQSSGQNITQTSSQETSDLLSGEPSSSFLIEDVDETPPPPPLPPMQWRVGKLHLGSLASSVDAVEPPAASNPFMELIAGDEKYPANPFASFAVVGNERYLEGPLIPKDEVAQPSRLSQLPPIAGDDREKSSVLCVRGVANPSNPGLVESHREDEKSRNGHDVPITQLYEGEGQSGQYRRPPLSHLLPSLELERSQHEGFSVPRNPILPLNPQLVGPYEEEWKHQYGYGVYGGESRQHLNFSAMGPNMPPYGFVYSLAENPSIVYDYMIPTVDGEKKYRSIRDRPRDPLIEAVAAHDKSTLRKVSELDLPSARPDTVERDSLLEQIRNKAFNLKPNAPKPNIKGVPQTNLKVAAILEKANAIRQACVGSVEDDDDGDSWSDS